jgi:ubiquitin carboxyl-terminal hydrolase 7
METKKRLQNRLGLADKDFARFRFALIQMATFKQPSYIEDGMFLQCSTEFLGYLLLSQDDNIYDHKFAPEDCLGLDHVDKSGKARGGAGERAIVIRG